MNDTRETNGSYLSRNTVNSHDDPSRFQGGIRRVWGIGEVEDAVIPDYDQRSSSRMLGRILLYALLVIAVVALWASTGALDGDMGG